MGCQLSLATAAFGGGEGGWWCSMLEERGTEAIPAYLVHLGVINHEPFGFADDIEDEGLELLWDEVEGKGGGLRRQQGGRWHWQAGEARGIQAPLCGRLRPRG